MKTVTATIQIGNSDDKLRQYEWSCFCDEVIQLVTCHDGIKAIHFNGYSTGNLRHQNACWVIEVENSPEIIALITKKLSDIRIDFHQESIAITWGDTTFI